MHCVKRIMCFITAAIVLSPALPVAAQDAAYDEAQLLKTLKSETEYIPRMQAFRGLRQVGTAESVPVLAEFLHDPTESHLARYALETMPLPEAGAALRDALDGAPESVLPGLITSLGAREDEKAVPLIMPLTDHDAPVIAHSAIAALGRIASEDAVAALMDIYAEPGENAIPVAEALLAAAQQLAGRKEQKAAAIIYDTLREEKNLEFIRVGAFYGLAEAAPEEAPERVLEALQGQDELYRNLAREIVAETEGEAATARYVEVLPELPADAQVALLSGLARRGDKSAREGVLALVSDDNPEVRTAAVSALAELGDAQDVPKLASLMLDSNEATASAARNSLIRLSGSEVNARIVAALDAVQPPLRARLLDLLAVRIAPEAVPQAMKYLSDDTHEVRQAALRVLQQQGSVAELEPVIALMKSNPQGEESGLAARTLGSIAAGSGEEALPIILANLQDAPETVQGALVEALGKIGGTEALEPVVALLDSEDETLKKTALRVLEEWPGQEAAPVLLDLASSDDPARHDAGLRGYTRLARTHPEHDPKNEMMAQAMDLARTKEEKWLVLSAYGTVHTGPAMDALEAQLDDPEVRREAAMALLKVAEAVSKHGEGGQARARKSLELLKEKVPVEYVQKQSDALLAKMK